MTIEFLENASRVRTFQQSNQYIKTMVMGDYTLFVFKPLKNFENDFDKFKEGKYSQFSGKYKGILRKLYPNTKKIKAILNPSEKDREKLEEELDAKLPEDSEIHSVPNELQETFSLGQFLEVEV